MKIAYPGEHQLPQLKKLWAEAFGDPERFIDGFFETGYDSHKCRCVLEGERLLAALYWFDGEFRGQKLAYLYAVATDPGCRGRGLCRDLMADTRKLLKNKGYAAALLLPGEPGLRRMYEKMGYRDCCQAEEFSTGAGEPVGLHEISWQEYEALRPDYLPEDGAKQEGLRFLSTYAHFYRGADFLLICAREEDRLLGLELLGNRRAASGILGALNHPTGTFRCPGEGKQMAMILPLGDSLPEPKYLGLTFD